MDQQQPYGYAGYQIPEPPPPRRNNTGRILALVFGCGCVGICIFCCVVPPASFFLLGGQFVFSVDDEVSNTEVVNRNGEDSAELTLDIAWGDVIIRNTVDEDTTFLSATYRYNVNEYVYRVAESRTASGVLGVTIDQPDGELVYVIPQDELISELAVAVVPTVATVYDLNIASGALSMTLSDAAATSIIADAASGEVSMALTGNFNNLTRIEVDAASGDVAVNHSGGSAELLSAITIDVASGESELVLAGQYLAALDITIDASSGEVLVDMSQASFEQAISINIEASSGDVRIILPEGIEDIVLNAETNSGDVTLFGQNVGSNASRSASGQQLFDIRVDASSGDIRIEN